MAERKHAQITPSGSSQSRANGRGRREIRRKTYFRERELIWIGVPKATQILLKNERTIRRKREKDLREFMSLKMDPLDSFIDFLRTFVMKFEEVNESDIRVTERERYKVLYHSLLEYSKNEMNETNIEIGDNE
uniref:Uncharacterized protein n=1 Tax=Solanum tuberosum TaxID=4113 RepID=M0ZYM3_SOLTU